MKLHFVRYHQKEVQFFFESEIEINRDRLPVQERNEIDYEDFAQSDLDFDEDYLMRLVHRYTKLRIF